MTRTPKHVSISRILRNRILRGVYQHKLPGLRTLANELGTDPRTVQMAVAQLEPTGFVRRVERKGTFVTTDKDGVFRAEINYLSIITCPPEILRGDTSFWQSAVLCRCHERASDRHLELMLRFSRDPVRAVATALDNLRDPHCAGTCLLSIPVNTAMALQMASEGGGIVVADWDIEETLLPCVVFDNFNAGRQAAEHLLKLGHRRILYVSGRRSSPSQEDRWRGFEQVVLAAALPRHDPIVDLYRLKSQVLRRLRGAHRPTAFVISSAPAADGIIQLARSAGFKVPDDLSVMTYGGYLNTVRGNRITSVVMDYGEMGRAAVEAIMEADGASRPRREVIPCTLVQGMTTGPAPS